ncbi:FAD-dependent oxidoreductase [Streptomyces sp. NPDC054904]|uniref:FAD-dependent oxidoreductase n=1 Tax=Streptomyces sp. NPDC090054 TaxID=3365933 RepID=UPI003820486E
MEHVDVVVVGAGQAGLATAYALVGHGLKPVVLEASDRSAGSWPRYYDSLTLFSPARFSSLPGVRPHRAPSAHSADPAGLRHRRIPSRRRRRPGRRPLFTSIAGKRVVWSDGVKEEVGAIVLATGYRPDLPYLTGLGIADGRGRPLHRDGFSVEHDRLAFVGLECQRSLSSNSLRGVGRDADRVARRLTSGLRSEDAPG